MRDEPIAYQVALAVLMGASFAAVSSFDPPLWLGSLLIGGIAVAMIGLLKAFRSHREMNRGL